MDSARQQFDRFQNLRISFQKNLLRLFKANPRQYVLILEPQLHKLKVLLKSFLPGKLPGAEICSELLQKLITHCKSLLRFGMPGVV